MGLVTYWQVKRGNFYFSCNVFIWMVLVLDDCLLELDLKKHKKQSWGYLGANMKDKYFCGSNFFIFIFLACDFLCILEDWYFISLNLLMMCLRFYFLVSGQSTEIALPDAVHSTLELGRIERERERHCLFKSQYKLIVFHIVT